jgi:transcriptional regulator with XRE-family HTH domain
MVTPRKLDDFELRMSENLRALRTKLGVPQADLAAKVGIHKSTLCEIESGLRPITLKTIRRLAEVWGLPAHEVLRLLEDPSDVTSF